MFMKKNKREAGLSLIEVLIVVGILAVLLLLGLQQVGTQMAKGRDARRKADLNLIKTTFEDYVSDTSFYPPFGILDTCGDPSGTALDGYIHEIPCDPADGSSYLYMPYPDFGDTSGGFRVFAKLEMDTDSDIETLGCNYGLGCGVPTTLVPVGAEEYNYGVSEGIPVYYTEGGTDIPTEGICCPYSSNNCTSSVLVQGACPGTPPYPPFPDLDACIQLSTCTN